MFEFAFFSFIEEDLRIYKKEYPEIFTVLERW